VAVHRTFPLQFTRDWSPERLREARLDGEALLESIGFSSIAGAISNPRWPDNLIVNYVVCSADPGLPLSSWSRAVVVLITLASFPDDSLSAVQQARAPRRVDLPVVKIPAKEREGAS
jgi:hypothetical protein